MNGRTQLRHTRIIKVVQMIQSLLKPCGSFVWGTKSRLVKTLFEICTNELALAEHVVCENTLSRLMRDAAVYFQAEPSVAIFRFLLEYSVLVRVMHPTRWGSALWWEENCNETLRPISACPCAVREHFLHSRPCC